MQGCGKRRSSSPPMLCSRAGGRASRKACRAEGAGNTCIYATLCYIDAGDTCMCAPSVCNDECGQHMH